MGAAEGAVVAVVAVVAVEVVEVGAEGCHCPDPEERDTEHPFPLMWTTNCTDKALTSLQETSEGQENLLPNGTYTGVSTSTRQ